MASSDVTPERPRDAADAQPLLRDIATRLARLEQLFELVPVLLGAAGVDPTHVPIATAAQILGVSVPTIRRKIRLGELKLEVIAGTKVSGIALSELYEQWIPIRVARAALARERSEPSRNVATVRRNLRGVRG
jgi:hypothetical protein